MHFNSLCINLRVSVKKKCRLQGSLPTVLSGRISDFPNYSTDRHETSYLRSRLKLNGHIYRLGTACIYCLFYINLRNMFKRFVREAYTSKNVQGNMLPSLTKHKAMMLYRK
jgi:hypothetical protein